MPATTARHATRSVAVSGSPVKKAAAIGVASEHGDQDILLLLQPYDVAPPLPRAIEDCFGALPKVMQPRWIEIVASLPMTPTHRLARKELPTRPGADAVDIEARPGSRGVPTPGA